MDICTMDIFDVSTYIMDVFSFLLIVHIERCHHFLSLLNFGTSQLRFVLGYRRRLETPAGVFIDVT